MQRSADRSGYETLGFITLGGFYVVAIALAFVFGDWLSVALLVGTLIFVFNRSWIRVRDASAIAAWTLAATAGLWMPWLTPHSADGVRIQSFPLTLFVAGAILFGTGFLRQDGFGRRIHGFVQSPRVRAAAILLFGSPALVFAIFLTGYRNGADGPYTRELPGAIAAVLLLSSLSHTLSRWLRTRLITLGAALGVLSAVAQAWEAHLVPGSADRLWPFLIPTLAICSAAALLERLAEARTTLWPSKIENPKAIGFNPTPISSRSRTADGERS